MDESPQPQRGTGPAAATGRWERLVRRVVGPPRSPEDRGVFHRIALIPFLAWVGMGSDGMSSSAYGPEEAFVALADHRYLAIPLALLVAGTVALIAACYMRIIARFPSGGGGYVVSTHLLGEHVGLVAGSALLVDYVLTVSVSIAAAADALFSVVPGGSPALKVAVAMAAIAALAVLNVRGVRESVTVMLPIFLLFVATHLVLILLGLGQNAPRAGEVVAEARAAASTDLSGVGLAGMALIVVRAYSMGAGTFTGIEAVSNGLATIREPRVEHGKRTMVYMAASLAFTAAGLLVCYLLAGIDRVPGKTLNAVLAERVFGGGGIGHGVVVATLAAEALLLVIAAQTGFIGGPQMMASMAVDSWMPRRFASLSDRLVTRNGVLLIAAGAAATVWATGGSTHTLVLMYSINVFVGFTLSQAGMLRAAFAARRAGESWKRHTLLHGAGLLVCAGILLAMIVQKFAQGAWLTVLLTGGLVGLGWLIRLHYRRVSRLLRELDRDLADIAATTLGIDEKRDLDPKKPLAVILVGGFSGFGVHTLLSIFRHFPGHFHQVAFVSVAVVDTGTFKGVDQVEALRSQTEGALQRYVDLATRLNIPATYEMAVGTEVPSQAIERIADLHERYPRMVCFGGKLAFRNERWYHRVLHNETAFAVERRLQWMGIPMVVLPIRAPEG